MNQPAPIRRGFTLIELMIVIAIISLFATIGLVTYSNTQKAARDSKREQDLINLAQALELYKQTNNSYPISVPGPPSDNMNNFYAFSNNSNWTTALGSLVPGIASLPKDPKNNCALIGNIIDLNCYSYVYWSQQSDFSNFPACPHGVGVMYVLIANLENPNDPNAIGPLGSPKRQVCGNDIQNDLYKAQVIDPNLYVIVGT